MSERRCVCRVCNHEGHHTGTCVSNAGKRWGALVFVRGGDPKGNGSTMFWCRCDCGVEKEFRVGHLRSGATTSCGCHRVGDIAKDSSYDPQIRYSVFEQLLTVGEIAAMANKRPDQIWRKIKGGMTAEEAAFGKASVSRSGVPEKSTGPRYRLEPPEWLDWVTPSC